MLVLRVGYRPRYALVGICALTLGFAVPIRLLAQRTSADATAPRLGLGVGFGIGSIPSAFHQSCTGGTHAGAATIDLRGGVHFGSLRLESTTAFRGSGASDACAFIPIAPDGVQTLERSAVDRGDLVVSDLRFGSTFGAGNSQWLLSAGAGWAWTHRLPVIVVAGGLRLGGSVRFTMDGELSYYRTASDQETAEWRGGVVVREISRDRDYHWNDGFTFRLGVELEPTRMMRPWH